MAALKNGKQNVAKEIYEAAIVMVVRRGLLQDRTIVADFISSWVTRVRQTTTFMKLSICTKNGAIWPSQTN